MNNSQDVFICYSRKDNNIAHYCSQLLKEINVSAFMDVDSLVAGSVFAETIQRQIVNCKIIVFIISENTMNSEWTIKEIDFARQIGKTIIPVLVENTRLEGRLMLLVGDIEYIEWRHDNTASFKKELVGAVQHHIEKMHVASEIHVQREIDLDTEIRILDEYQPKRIDYDVFVSYRREGGRDIARSIKYRLEMMGFNKVFFDYNSIRDGMFNTQIMDAIYSCNDFLLLLTPNSMNKCGEKGDWVAREIRTAKKYERKIIPIALENDFEWPISMPSDLFDVKYIQRHNLLMNEDFDYSIEKLSKRLKSVPSSPNNFQSELYYKIRVNKNCKLFIDGKEYCILESGMVKKIPMKNRGEYLIELFNLEISERLIQKIVSIEQDKVDIVEL